MTVFSWLADNYIEIFGAVTGIIYVFLEIRQTLWLWPVGIITSAFYIWIFLTGKIYADMSLQGYYLVISCLGWYWWAKRKNGREEEGENRGKIEERVGEGEEKSLKVTRLQFKTGVILAGVFIILFAAMWFILSDYTDSPVPVRDSFITSLSIVATWMLARKIYEHWLLWIVVNSVSTVFFVARGLYPTAVLYAVYCVMSFVGLIEWKKSILLSNQN
ncbi:MAG: nicotinamide riboside transporter PnuC [Bacteroidales bacterium]|nr:nicotinamide riboside transporter PnuC [Bacteroidales bacterium]